MKPLSHNRFSRTIIGWRAAFIVILGALACHAPDAVPDEEVKITFIVETPAPLPEGDQVYIAGNTESLGNWAPDAVPLSRTSVTTWQFQGYFPRGARLEYKFTRGTWNREAVNPDCSVPGNLQLKVKSEHSTTLTIEKWKDFCAQAHGGITGTVKYHKDFPSAYLDYTRDIVVWLPPGYEDEDMSYPVLYMHDGQNLFDPATSAFGYDWQVDETATRLIGEGKMKRVIIVGIYSSPVRTIEYSPVHRGEDYARFLIEELKPFVDSHYRTLKDADNTAVMGSSMGGIISFHLAWEYPQVFRMAGCLSPAFLVDGNEILKRVKRYSGPKKNIRIYMDNGTEDLDRKLKRGFRKMEKLLKKQGFTAEDLMVFTDEGATHNEQAWAKRIHKPLLFFFGQ